MTKGNRSVCPQCKGRLTVEGCNCVTCDACGYVDASECIASKGKLLASFGYSPEQMVADLREVRSYLFNPEALTILDDVIAALPVEEKP